MKIALVTETFLPSTDGVVTRLTNALDYILEKGHEVIIICPEDEGIEKDYKGAKIYPMAAFKFPFYTQRQWAIPSLKIKEILEEFQPDLVHAANPISLAASGVYYSKKLGIPLICSFHTNIPNYLDHYHLNFLKPHIWNYLRELHNSASINLVTSKAMYKLLEENGIQGLRVLPIGVDVINRHKKFYSEEMRDKLTGGEKDKKLLIFVGRLAPEKEIESLKELMDSREDVRLAIIGDGPSREDLEKLFEGTNTIFTGFLKGEELSQAYATGDALIFPSQSETLGLVITEAMASKTPVIAAFSEPTIEQIKDRENGFIYQRNSLASLNSCIDSLDDKELLNKIKEKGREFAENLSWEKASKAMVDAYYEALENSKDN